MTEQEIQAALASFDPSPCDCPGCIHVRTSVLLQVELLTQRGAPHPAIIGALAETLGTVLEATRPTDDEPDELRLERVRRKVAHALASAIDQRRANQAMGAPMGGA